MRFVVIAFIFLVIGLIKDYQKDKGRHVKAKVFHAICLTVIIYSYAGSFQILGMLIRDFDGAHQRFSVPVGFVSGDVHWIIYLIHSALVMTIIILAYQMIRRSEKARRMLVILLPIAGLLEVFGFYRGWVSGEANLGVSDGLIILIGLVIVGGITLVIYLVYSSEFMKTFFVFEHEKTLADTQVIDSNMSGDKN
jgi:hypothetical protein